jgi:hypothetical protein
MSAALWIFLLASGVVAIIRLLDRLTAMGGNSDRPATEVFDQVRGEVDVYRGSRTPDDRPWDGRNRIAPPISDGTGGFAGG